MTTRCAPVQAGQGLLLPPEVELHRMVAAHQELGSLMDRAHGAAFEALGRQLDRQTQAILGQPSHSLADVALKLTLWRSEAAAVHRGGFFHHHESFAFSAYLDVLRLAGLERLAHADDAETARNLDMATN